VTHAQRRPGSDHFGETAGSVPHPPIVSRKQWLVERRKLLDHEKESSVVEPFPGAGGRNPRKVIETAALRT